MERQAFEFNMEIDRRFRDNGICGEVTRRTFDMIQIPLIDGKLPKKLVHCEQCNIALLTDDKLKEIMEAPEFKLPRTITEMARGFYALRFPVRGLQQRLYTTFSPLTTTVSGYYLLPCF